MVQESETYVKSNGQSLGDFLPPPLQESINKIIEEEAYITYDIFSRSFSSGGANFMADLYELNIKGKTTDGEKETNIFIKKQIEDSQLSILDVDKCYNTERLFYQEVSRKYHDIQNKANIPVEERYVMIKSYDCTSPNAIILENVAKKGFATIHRTEVPSIKFAQLVIQQLARFHGLSWVLENQQPEFFAKKIKVLKNKFILSDDFQGLITNMASYVTKCMDEDKKDKFDKFASRMMETLNNFYFDNSESRCCLIHADLWNSNILVKKDGDDISELIPVDYQLMYYGCPVMDFIFFIFICFDQEFRRKHLNELKDLYHNSLGKFLKYFDMDVESVYPRYEFEAEYEKRREFGLIKGIILLPTFFTDDDSVPDINKEDLSTVIVNPGAKWVDRIKGLLDDFEEWGVL